MLGFLKKKGDGKTSRDDKKDTRNEEPDRRDDPTYEEEGTDIICTKIPRSRPDGMFDSMEGVYMGEKVGGVPDGKGECMYPHAMYTGMFKQGKLHGQGTFQYFGEYTYTGEFENDRFSGKGTYTDKYNFVYEGTFVLGGIVKGKLTYSDGDYYVGEFLDYQPHGHGTLYEKKRIVEGNFVFGLPYGEVLVTVDGKTKRTKVKNARLERINP